MIKLLLLDRGDRKPLTDWILERFSGYDVIHPTFTPESDQKDIVQRLRSALVEAQDCEWVYIIENDDYYPKDYIDKMEAFRKGANADWIGDYNPYYYNIADRRYQKMNLSASGLWCMGFRPQILNDMNWLDNAHVSMDSWISKHVKKYNWCKFQEHGGIGIKGHGMGLSGSTGHSLHLKHDDLNMSWLRKHTDESFFKLHNLVNSNKIISYDSQNSKITSNSICR
jgi:hypothetical protein